MIRIAIVDDEPACAQALQKMLSDYQKEADEDLEVKYYSNGSLFLDNYQAGCDIIFMDIAMPGLNGMDTIRTIRAVDNTVVVIFVSSLAQFALEGYSVDAMDFLVKPVSEMNFKLKLKKAISHVKQIRQQVLLLPDEFGELFYISLQEIYYIESQNHTVYYHTVKGTFRKTEAISKLETALAPYQFFRCDISYIVNPAYVTNMGSDFVIVQGERIPVSRNRKKDFFGKMNAYRRFLC